MDKPERPAESPSKPPASKLPDFTPYIVLAAALGLIALGLYLFPMVKSMMVYQDCVASGRVDCSRR